MDLLVGDPTSRLRNTQCRSVRMENFFCPFRRQFASIAHRRRSSRTYRLYRKPPRESANDHSLCSSFAGIPFQVRELQKVIYFVISTMFCSPGARKQRRKSFSSRPFRFDVWTNVTARPPRGLFQSDALRMPIGDGDRNRGVREITPRRATSLRTPTACDASVPSGLWLRFPYS